MNNNLEQVNVAQMDQGRILDLLIITIPLIGLSGLDILSILTSIKPRVNKYKKLRVPYMALRKQTGRK